MIEITPMLACPSHAAMLAISLTLQAAGAAASYISAKATAKKRETYQEHIAQMKGEAAQRKVSSIHARTIQERVATAQKMEAASRQLDKVAAQSRLSASAGGIAGLTTAHLAQSYEASQGAYVAQLTAEQSMREANALRMSEDIMLGAEQQMFAARAPIAQPTLLTSALTFGAEAADQTYAVAKKEDWWGLGDDGEE